MNAKAEFEKFVVDQMAGFGPITQKRMFGGLAFYHNGLIFGMVIDDALFLKADDQSKQRFEAENLKPFTYQHKSGKEIAMAYWRAPERCLDDPEEMTQWCGLAFQAALRSRKPVKKAVKKKPKSI